MNYLPKLRRAEFHLAQIESSFKQWQDQNPYKAISYFEPQTGEHVLRVGVKPMPEDWSLVAGDFLFNLRAALDHLAFHLAVKGKGTPLTEAEAKSCSFPIYDVRKPPSKLRESLPHVCSKAFAVIQSVQPYQDPDTAHDSPLWFLARMNNIDKHRSIHIAATVTPDEGIMVTGIGTGRIVWAAKPGEPLDNDAELVRFTIGRELPRQGDMNIDARMAQCFTEAPGPIYPFEQKLRLCLEWVQREVILPIDPFL